MSKHLTSKDIDSIIDTIGRMRGAITWEKLTAKLQSELGITHSKYSLMRNTALKAAYNIRKAELRDSKAKKVQAQKAAKSKLPPDPAAYIADLERRLQQQTELLATVLDNAARLGVPIENMQRPPRPVSYSPTKSR